LYQDATNSLAREFDQISALTSGASAQQEQLDRVRADLAKVTAYSDRLLNTRDAQGLSAAVQMESSGEGLALANRAVADLQVFMDEENRQLIDESTVLEAKFQNNMWLLRIGRLLVLVVLITALWMAGRELNRRRSAEAQNLKLIGELQASLAEVRT